MIRLFTDPRLFASLLIALMLAQSGCWCLMRKPWDALYWILAAGMTAVLTFGFKR